MIRADLEAGGFVEHRGTPPFVARSASDKTDDWHAWIVVGSDGANRIHFPAQPGAVLLPGRRAAERIAACLNDAASRLKTRPPQNKS
jgi:hypothetical protein